MWLPMVKLVVFNANVCYTHTLFKRKTNRFVNRKRRVATVSSLEPLKGFT